MVKSRCKLRRVLHNIERCSDIVHNLPGTMQFIESLNQLRPMINEQTRRIFTIIILWYWSVKLSYRLLILMVSSSFRSPPTILADIMIDFYCCKRIQRWYVVSYLLISLLEIDCSNDLLCWGYLQYFLNLQNIK